MTLTPGLKVLLIMNNYFHDVATAVLLASAVILWVLGRRAREDGPEAVRWLASAYPVLTRFVRGALVWIVVGGIPRTVFFAQLEWDPAVTKYLVPALIVKHVLMALAVTGGTAMWLRIRAAVRDLGPSAGTRAGEVEAAWRGSN